MNQPRSVVSALLAPRVVVPLVAIVTSLIELAIADRKYGVFTGGFGQLQAVDTLAERLVFFAAYALSQIALALMIWSFCASISRRGTQLAASVRFAFLFGGAMLLTLVGRYQLHSYFSDAIDLTLMKNLGGGTIGGALLYSKNELALGMVSIAALLAVWWIAERIVRRFAAADGTPPRPLWRVAGYATTLWVAALWIVPQISEDAARGLNRMIGWGTANTIAATLTDFDRDGYGLVGLQTDPHPFDGARHPLALDIPGNGVDEDGYGGDLTLVPVPQPRPHTVIPAGAPHLVVVLMESTRADAIGKTIDGELVAPNLTALANAGTGVTSYSHVGFTTFSLKSIFTGDLAPAHGAPSLFTDLKASGYRISVISGQAEGFGDVAAAVGMRDSADVLVDAENLKDQRASQFSAQASLLIDEQIVLREFERALGRADDWDKPQFVYLNFQSPHFPYHHEGVPHRFAHPPLARSEIAASKQAEVERTYWNAVAHADAALGTVIARLKALGQWDNTIMLVTGDHGESLFEDGFLGHGHIINQRQNATFLVLNRSVSALTGPVAISDYRGIVLDLLLDKAPRAPAFAPFMQIGDLDQPTAIGLAGTPFGIVTLRLDRGTACFERPAHCADYSALTGQEREAVDQVVARWGSERWARQPKTNPRRTN